MAQVSTQVINLLKKYIKELDKNDFQITAAILFGSYSNGKNHEFSDIDIALVSDKFEGVRFFDKEKIRRITIDIDYRISPFPYKTEDFTKEDMFVEEILKTGVRIV